MTPRRVRLLAILAPAVVAGVALLAWTQPWVDATIEGGVAVTAAGDVAVSYTHLTLPTKRIV